MKLMDEKNDFSRSVTAWLSLTTLSSSLRRREPHSLQHPHGKVNRAAMDLINSANPVLVAIVVEVAPDTIQSSQNRIQGSMSSKGKTILSLRS